MIKSWKHKGLKLFFETGSTKGIQHSHASKLGSILQFLDAAIKPADMHLPGMNFHKLHGKLKQHYSVTVNGNWRVIFKFENHHAVAVDYLDYH